jgi:small GTP-binding protein
MTKEKKEERNNLYPKINFFGLGGTGKTTIIHRLLSGNYKEGINYNLKADFYQLNITKKNKRYKAILWDFVGYLPLKIQTTKTIYSNYFRDCKLAFCVFSLTDRESLKFLQETMNYVKQEIETIILIGNKSDLFEKREITLEEIQDLTNEHKIKYIEISALNGSNFDQILDKIIEVIETSGKK